MADPAKIRRFEQVVMPHMDAAYNLAYWLTRSDADAQDVVQEACLRAFKYFDSFEGEYPAAWLLSIVRRSCYTWLKRNRPAEETVGLDEGADEEERDYAPLLTAAAYAPTDRPPLIAASSPSAASARVSATPATVKPVCTATVERSASGESSVRMSMPSVSDASASVSRAAR